jgi:hypothetical protein
MKPIPMLEPAKTSDPLVVFLYHLLQDHLPFGTVEAIVQKHIESGGAPEVTLAEPQMARYATILAQRLR